MKNIQMIIKKYNQKFMRKKQQQQKRTRNAGEIVVLVNIYDKTMFK